MVENIHSNPTEGHPTPPPKKRTAVAAQGWHGRPTHGLIEGGARSCRSSLYRHRGLITHAGGRREASMSIPRPDDLSHLVRPCERCRSDRVADRPSALHPEAPERGG